MENQDRLMENVNVSITDVNGSQYMIQRMDANHQLISSDLLQHHNGLVVDLGAGDFIPVNYTSDDLQDLTEEDRNLAAALVAVQLSQQQKQQQLQQDSIPVSEGNNKVILSTNQQLVLDKQGSSYLEIVDNDGITTTMEGKLIDSQFYETQSEQDQMHLIKTEEESINLHSDDDNNIRAPSAKKSLPHKKRISRKLQKKSEKTLISRTKVLHSCSVCDQVFASIEDYNNHQGLCNANIQPITNMFSCQLCHADFSDQMEFFSHLKAHYEPIVQVEEQEPTAEINEINNLKHESQLPPLINSPSKDNLLSSLLTMTCIECNRTFRKQKTYEAHMKDYHGGSVGEHKEEEVEVRLDEFSEPEDLMADIQVREEEEEEDVGESQEMGLEQEMDDGDQDDGDNKTWYTGDDELQATEEDLKEIEAQEHVCHICSQPFPIRAILMQHLITCRVTNSQTAASIPIHPSELVGKKKPKKKPDLNCTECDRVFTHRNSLVYHMRSHTGHRPHQCDQCGKSFFAASALKVHMRLHSGDKPYKCNDCARSFRQWGDLKYHCISIHSDTKQYQCEYCGKDFARKYSLIVHRRIHTGEKNYRCEFCGKTFRASSYLQNHRRIHTGEKPHECVYCHKRFRVRSDMKRHVRTHSIKKAPGRSLTAIALDEYPAILRTATPGATIKKYTNNTQQQQQLLIQQQQQQQQQINGGGVITKCDMDEEDNPDEVDLHDHEHHEHQIKIKQLTDTESSGNEGEMEEDIQQQQQQIQQHEQHQMQLKDENDAAVAALQYEDQLEIETVQDGNTLYVMPILIA